VSGGDSDQSSDEDEEDQDVDDQGSNEDWDEDEDQDVDDQGSYEDGMMAISVLVQSPPAKATIKQESRLL
jgi:hypothetical protein